MVSRIEVALLAALLFFASRAMVTDLAHTQEDSVTEKKKLELFSLSFREANQTALLHTITADHMIQYPDKTLYKTFALYSPELKFLSSRAIEKKRRIYLENNVTILKIDGSHYTAGAVMYDKQHRRMELSKYFSFSDRHGTVEGTQIQYDGSQKELRGEAIKARYEIE